jgi:hypothetical protein
MKKITFLFGLIVFCVLSCNKEAETFLDVQEYYMVNNSSTYIYISGETNVCHSSEYHFVTNSTIGISGGGKDTAVFFDREFEHLGDDIILDSEIKFGHDLDHLETKLNVESYIFRLSSIQEVKSSKDYIIYHKHYYVFTDSLIQNIKDSMAVKGIFPEKVD